MLVHYGREAVKTCRPGRLAESFCIFPAPMCGANFWRPRLGVEANLILDDEQQIHTLFDAGDRALMSADIESLARIFADDYVQYDPAGRAFTKQEVLQNLRSGTVRYPVISSTGRRIRLFRGPQTILPVRPHKPRDPRQQQQPDHRIELVEVFAQAPPIFSQLHAEVRQCETPRP